jgi:crotonobetainyl-CoA:carnitine CoA-transferase CaiB-like acyl-CoA transferase
MRGLRDLRVVDFTTQIAGPYCTKLFADAGADVVKIEPPAGDPLRRWSVTRPELGGEDGALFRFLNAGKRSVIGAPGDAAVLELVAGAGLVVESFEPGAIDALDLPGRFPGLTLLSISPYGRGGPWSRRPATEFTIQADCGSIGTRGLPGQEPFQAGGRTTEWVAGTFAAVGALAAVARARRSGRGEHVDFSVLEVMTIAGTNYMDLLFDLLGIGELSGLPQSLETPSIEPTRDGYVGFCTNTRQQFSDFLLLIGRPDLREDEELAQFGGRIARFEEWNAIVHAYTREHTTAEIVEAASLLRIPVAPVNDGERVLGHEQLVARGVFRDDPSGTFRLPRPPYRIGGEEPPPFRPAPRLGEHTGAIEPRPRATLGARGAGELPLEGRGAGELPLEGRGAGELPLEGRGAGELPLEGLRILDLTAWWAGPSATHMLATLGADVIHVESTRKPDGMRMVGGMLAAKYDDWWECSHFYLAANCNKRGLCLNLTHPRGLELMMRLIQTSDAIVDNFTPRVLDGFGLTWEAIHAANPRAIMVRMPAFGLSGPWRDHTGFAQTMEQMTGLAWLTGHAEDQPRIQRGPCDPLAGMHAAFAFLVALEEREALGEGVHVECAMVEGALNAAAEQLIEFTAYGGRMQREGNRSPAAAPQGLYACRGHNNTDPCWLALSVADDAQWAALAGVLGRPGWAAVAELASHRGRREHHDRIDAQLRPWFAEREREALIEALVAAGVPAAAVRDPRAASRHPQLMARGFFESLPHPVVGTRAVPTVPFRYRSVDHWLRTPAPTLGQHSREILAGIGVSADELDSLEADGVIGTRPGGI